MAANRAAIQDNRIGQPGPQSKVGVHMRHCQVRYIA